jgi:flagellar hook assembly protein FlgD
VHVVVLDVAGREVLDLGTRGMPAGDHVIAWDGRNTTGARVPAGLYSIVVHAADTAVTHPIVMIR